MSLVGSLEDLGLADILQIASLSRKSGVLRLRSDGGDGRIALREGLVCAALVKGLPEDLRSLLGAGGHLSEAELDAAEARVELDGIGFADALCAGPGLDRERLEAIRREHTESCALRMFGWRYGEFSFEVGVELEAPEVELCVAQGLSAQYLAMEATRSEGDALAAAGGSQDGADSEGPWFSGEEPGAAAARDPVASTRFDRRVSGVEPLAADAPARGGEGAGAAAPLVILDSELLALEWAKDTLSGHFSRVHIFQSSDAAVARIRYYLGHGELPVVLLAALPAGGAPGLAPAPLAQRLRALAARMPIVMICDEASLPVLRQSALAELAEAFAVRPSTAQLARGSVHPEAAARLIETLLPWSHPAQRGAQRGARAEGSPVPPSLQRLRDASQRLREAATPSEVLSGLLEFSALHFPRAALFALRQGRARGVAGRGLERCGGPDDARLRQVELEVATCAWFQRAVQARHPTLAPPQNEGDRALARQLGTELPDQAYLAPLESGGEVVALLYADRLPEGRPIADLTPLEILVHQACVALERAVLLRAHAPSSSQTARR